MKRLIEVSSLAGAAVFLAVAVGSGPSLAAAAPSDEAAEALFRRDDVPLIRIEIPPAGMEALRAYEFRRGSNPEARTNVAATIREGDRVYTNVAVHLKGSLGSFREIDDRPALTLSFDRWAEGQSFHGLKKISLNNSVQDWSYSSEIICREVFRAAGLPCPRGTHARVELNGRELGLYVLLEGWSKQFLKRHFPDTRGNLWDSGSAGDITARLDAGSGEHPEDRSRLDDLVEATRGTNLTARLEQMARVVDMDRFLTLIATEVMLMHWDGYAMNKNNYRVFHDRSIDRLVFLPQGMDQMFGQFRNYRPDGSITPMMKGLAAKAVLQVPEGRRRYLNRMEAMLNRVFNVAKLTNHVDAISAKLQRAPGVDLGTRVRQMAAAGALKDRIIRREASVREQLVTASTPVKFGPSGEYELNEWTPSRDSGNPSFQREATPLPTLQISASGSRCYGSWRTEVYLDEGDYQLVGRFRVAGGEYTPDVVSGGATIRVSGDRNAPMARQTDGWQAVTYDIHVSGREDLVLVCEFRATKGSAVFDASSLKLVKKGAQPKPANSPAPQPASP